MTEILELHEALEAIAAGDMTRESMVRMAKKAIGEIEVHSECGNCGEEWAEDELDSIENLEQRIGAGEEVPSGQCPDCGSLCHLIANEEKDNG
jgi:Zn finger protein HypA/HybF involved in hydrogenase expression